MIMIPETETEWLTIPVASSTQSGVLHLVDRLFTAEGVPHWSCDCKGYGFHGHCKHIAIATEQVAAQEMGRLDVIRLREATADLAQKVASWQPENMREIRRLRRDIIALGKLAKHY